MNLEARTNTALVIKEMTARNVVLIPVLNKKTGEIITTTGSVFENPRYAYIYNSPNDAWLFVDDDKYAVIHLGTGREIVFFDRQDGSYNLSDKLIEV